MKLTDEEIIDLYLIKRLRVRELAVLLETTENKVKYKISKLGLNESLRRPKKEELYDFLINKEMTYEEIGKIYRLSASQISNYIKKFDINIGDKYIRYNITNLQNDIIIGSILGDGCITKKKTVKNYHFSISHAENQKKYLEYKFDIMRNLCNYNNVKEKKVDEKWGSYNKQKLYWFYTKDLPQFTKYKELTVEDICNNLNINSFLIWVMDDGRLDRGRYYTIGCTRLKKNDISTIINEIKNKFNIQSEIDWDDREHTKIKGLKFNADNSRKLSMLFEQSDFYWEIKNTMSYKFINY